MTTIGARRDHARAPPLTPEVAHRIVPHLSKVRGRTITPSHFLNQQLDSVWLAE